MRVTVTASISTELNGKTVLLIYRNLIYKLAIPKYELFKTLTQGNYCIALKTHLAKNKKKNEISLTRSRGQGHSILIVQNGEKYRISHNE